MALRRRLRSSSRAVAEPQRRANRDDEPGLHIAEAVTAAGAEPDVVIEAAYGWYWIVDLLQELGATLHLASPKGVELR
jgi:hypothetical protein